MLKQRRRGITGKFPSNKVNRLIYWESILERDLIYHLEFDPKVLSYHEQPLRINALIDGKSHHYTPDFLVETDTETKIIEVKPIKYIEAPETKQQVIIGEAFCAINNITFILLTEDNIRGPLLENIKILFRYSYLKPNLKQIHSIINLIIKNGPASMFEISNLIKSNNQSENIKIIYYLIYKKHLLVNLSEPLCGQTIIYGVDVKNV